MFGRKRPVESPFARFQRTYAPAGTPGIDFTIHPDDEMYTIVARGMGPGRASMHYFKLGSELTRTIKQIANWRFGQRLDRVRLLEFACGYGRNVRHLLNVFPKENILVSDIMEKAVDFNLAQLKVAARVSVHDPADLNWTERFDMIVVPSLFSHLPQRTFAGWIAALYGLLSDEGILVFSVLGDNVLEPEACIPESGIHFELHSENEVLDKEEYGLAHVTESFVKEQILRATGQEIYGLVRRGFWKHQDVYILTKSDSIDPTAFRYDQGLIGHVDQVILEADGTIRLAGWAAETRQAANVDVVARAYMEGRKVAEAPVLGHRPDVAKVWGKGFVHTGFLLEFTADSPVCGPESNLIIEIASEWSTECLHSLGLKDSLTEDRRGSFPNTSISGRVDERHARASHRIGRPLSRWIARSKHEG